jgi:RND family efflux transporter MFP subunit
MVLPVKHSIHKICLLFGLATLILTPITGCSKKKEEAPKEVVRPAKILTIKQGGSTETSKYPGKVQALDRVEVSFEVSGKLISLPIKEGQRIKKGSLIARLDASDYLSRLEAAQARVSQTKAEVERYANLLSEKVVAKSTYDVKRKNYEVAVSDMRITQKAVNDTYLRAPFSGIIGKKFIDNYQVVQAKQPIVSLQKTTAIDIIVNAPEQLVGQSGKYNIKLLAEFANYPEELYPVKIKEFSTEADSQTQTYRIVLTMPVPKGKSILDGMTATVHMERQLKDSTATSAVKIPVQSVFYDDAKQAHVWKLEPDMTIRETAVKVGTMDEGNITILSGLNPGDKIITAGVQKLTAGTRVREFTGTMGE